MKNIAGVEPNVPLGALAVDLDALEADILLQQGRGQQRQIFGDKAVQPLSGVVFSNGKFPQGDPPYGVMEVPLSYLFAGGM